MITIVIVLLLLLNSILLIRIDAKLSLHFHRKEAVETEGYEEWEKARRKEDRNQRDL
ncbi:hypothetical protein [Gorillibacterium timonense]|uniref:hypothetical protein n=1 Tax=Gorillibacterium timonense TaxID=1689269 RepID=UPI00131BD5D1|nr:hypothetical protein [Gorillibacterium timonense]